MNIFEDAPHINDPRQQKGMRAIAGIVGKMQDDGADTIGVISMRGFPASAVDLGWLQSRIRDAWGSRQLDITEDLRALVKETLPNVVQRLKRFDVELLPCSNLSGRRYQDLQMLIVTKDDLGWYEYDFYVRLWLDDA